LVEYWIHLELEIISKVIQIKEEKQRIRKY
jgi:hypothetical protein